jgi:hypothetical protein
MASAFIEMIAMGGIVRGVKLAVLAVTNQRCGDFYICGLFRSDTYSRRPVYLPFKGLEVIGLDHFFEDDRA